MGLSRAFAVTEKLTPSTFSPRFDALHVLLVTDLQSADDIRATAFYSRAWKADARHLLQVFGFTPSNELE